MRHIRLSTSIQQKPDLTFKHNMHQGRHGWLRLTPAYSVKLVSRLLDSSDRGIRVLDPFSGTATTPLCAAYAGDTGTGLEINPFLTWLGKTKLAAYSRSDLQATRDSLDALIAQASRRTSALAPLPPIRNINRWWHSDQLAFLRKFKGALDALHPDQCPTRDLLLVVFCRLVIRLSNAAFNHQSMSFKDNANTSVSNTSQGLLFETGPDFSEIARVEGKRVLDGADANPEGSGTVVGGDARLLSRIVSGKYDLLITSPPYPNRMSYIRELRPYMYWLGYLRNGREAGELDWDAIGGTWGVATSRLVEWERSPDGFYPSYFEKILARIRGADAKSGVVLSNYVARYFEDIWKHIREAPKVMKAGARVHYVVGNSRFYETVVPVERLFAEMLSAVGFRDVVVTRIRKRNSKKELYEFDVSATR